MATGIPEWLRVSDDGRRFELLPEKVELVRTMFEWANGGMRPSAVARKLNGYGMPCFLQCEFDSLPGWRAGFVERLLRDRAVIGESPHAQRMRDGRPGPEENAMPVYVPPIIDEQEFDSVQRFLDERLRSADPRARRVANLFAGLVKDARDGSEMVLIARQDEVALVSGAAKDGVPGAKYLWFPYEPFEKALFIWGYADPETGALMEKLRSAEDDEAACGLRRELRAALKRLVSDVVVLVVRVNGDRVAFSDVCLVSGKRRYVIIRSRESAAIPKGLDELDVRKWTTWPKEFRKARFKGVGD
jgi:hypothetical protein